MPLKKHKSPFLTLAIDIRLYQQKINAVHVLKNKICSFFFLLILQFLHSTPTWVSRIDSLILLTSWLAHRLWPFVRMWWVCLTVAIWNFSTPLICVAAWACMHCNWTVASAAEMVIESVLFCLPALVSTLLFLQRIRRRTTPWKWQAVRWAVRVYRHVFALFFRGTCSEIIHIYTKIW